ncbi:MAG: ABC-2 family transporter protein [Eubacteriales bacterium]|nr:ABC-2 family transporter protein [Eubacteriales bacterium]
MNIDTLFYVFKTQILKSLAYKFDVYGNILMQTIIMIASAYFWKALFKNASSIQGVTVETMMTYTVISSLISVLLTCNVERRIMKSVEKGTVAIDLMRPVNIFHVYFAENLGSIVALIFQNLLPILLIGSLLIGIPAPASKESLLFFFPSLLLAFFINWFLAVIFGMWAFTAISMDPLIQVKKHLIRLLSGSIIPLWFFPAWLKTILKCLPFIYLYQIPLDLYIGKYDKASLFQGFMIQIIWVIGLYLCYRYLSSRVSKKVMVQGG